MTPHPTDPVGFTKGPWSLVNRGGDRYIVDGEGDPLGAVFTETWDDQQETVKTFPWEANARLIAAAPDLYEACHLALSYLDDPDGGTDDQYREAQASARAALAKARGES